MDKPKSQNLKSFKEKIIKTFIHGFLHLLGFDHEKFTYDFQGRPFRLTDVEGEVIREILA